MFAVFAATPCGEWNASELEYYVEYLGFTPAQALHCATQTNGQFLRNADQVGILEAGRRADILIANGDPLTDISVLQDKSLIRNVFIAEEPIALEINDTIKPAPLATSYSMWNEAYTQERVAVLRGQSHVHKPAVLRAV